MVIASSASSSAATVAGRFDYHTPDERIVHADCALDVYGRLVAAAGQHRLQVVFELADGALLDALVARPRWPGQTDGDIEVRLAGESGAIWDRVLSQPTRARLDIIEYLASRPSDAQMEAYRLLGVELCIWSYATTRELLASIEGDAPAYVLTGEALLLRRWLER